MAELRRLHGARRARGTSLCPGHILLFGLVNILFSSLLSKSLTIKGREARPGRERGLRADRKHEMAFGNTEERLSQFGNERQILNAIREHYLMKREADHGSQLFGIGFFWR